MHTAAQALTLAMIGAVLCTPAAADPKAVCAAITTEQPGLVCAWTTRQPVMTVSLVLATERVPSYYARALCGVLTRTHATEQKLGTGWQVRILDQHGAFLSQCPPQWVQP